MKSKEVISRRAHQRGIAMIIVMISIFVLTILATGFAISMKVETKLAMHANNEIEMQWLGRSGVEYCRWILAAEAQCHGNYDALDQKWAGGGGSPFLPCATNGPLMDVQNPVQLGPHNGTFSWKMTDLERKWNINKANEAILKQGLMLVGVDGGQVDAVMNSILDWIRPVGAGGVSRLGGTESDYYRGLDTPYDAKGNMIDDLSELLLIRGVTPEIYWGLTSSNHPPVSFLPQENRLGWQSSSAIHYDVGLAELFTPISSGQLNINTCSAAALEVIPGITSDMAEAIVGGRGGEDDGTGLMGPYRDLGQIQRLGLPPYVSGVLGQYGCGVRSSTFEVEITASVAGSSRTFHAVLFRTSPRDVHVLRFYWKI